jgi:hypothetical protein
MPVPPATAASRAWSHALYVCVGIPTQLAGLLVPVIFGYWARDWALPRWRAGSGLLKLTSA